MNFLRTVLIPCLIVIAAGGAAWLMVHFRKPPQTLEPVPYIPAVEVETVQPEDTVVWIESQGTVQARTETTLTAEVSGNVCPLPRIFAQADSLQRVRCYWR